MPFSIDDDSMDERLAWIRYVEWLVSDMEDERSDAWKAEQARRREGERVADIATSRTAPARGASGHRLTDYESAYLDRIEGNR